MKDDIKLVSEVLNGNIDSFNIIVNKYEIVVFRFVYNMIKNKEAAEDITQEVFINVYNKLYLYDKKYKFSNWLLQIARNKCIDYIRKYKRVYESDIDEVVGLTSREPSPEENYEFKEMKYDIEKYINSLDLIDKQIIVLKYSKDTTFKDISNILNINESSVKRRYYKVKEKFMKIKHSRKRGVANEL